MKRVRLMVDVEHHERVVEFTDEEWADMEECGTTEDELWTLADEFMAEVVGAYYEIED